jgi:hypothetical protein
MSKFMAAVLLVAGSFAGFSAGTNADEPSGLAPAAATGQNEGWFYADYGPYDFATAVRVKNNYLAGGGTAEVVGDNQGNYWCRVWWYE